MPRSIEEDFLGNDAFSLYGSHGHVRAAGRANITTLQINVNI